jgi:formylglycine-generating enzyme required for sulfatase activity
MGSPAGELGRAAGEVQHQVTITRAFLMKTTEVTQAEWQAVMGNNPSRFAACGGDCPVEEMSWNDAVDYVNRLSDATGLARCYDADRRFAGLDCAGYRLPTEAEWEYACRAGTQTPFYNGSQDDNTLGNLAWYGGCAGCSGNSGGQTHVVGLKLANAFGFHDMLGNVWEWVNDWYGDYTSAAQTNPTGPVSGSYRVIRGGAWVWSSLYARSSYRGLDPPDSYHNILGFRVARTP